MPTKFIGVLTSGGDCPGLNAAIRAVGKRDGFRGFMENRTMELDNAALSGILTQGGTILGTSREKPHRMPVGGKLVDMTGVMAENYRKHNLDVLVCLGGGGTQKNAYRLAQQGLNVITLPKTIDNDVPLTDVTFGFDTALSVATEAIDRLHSTAHSHHRIILVEIMGNKVGWLGLGAGIAGGADVILIPEIPYQPEYVAEAIRDRARAGKRFSIVVVAEGAMSVDDAKAVNAMLDEKKAAKSKADKKKVSQRLDEFHQHHLDHTLRLTRQLEQMTGQESRLTILGHLQRGGTPSAADRLLATRLGTSCAEVLSQDVSGVMIAARGEGVETVPLEEVAGEKKLVPPDHPWVRSARLVGTCVGNS